MSGAQTSGAPQATTTELEAGGLLDQVLGATKQTERDRAQELIKALTEEFQSGACHAGQFETSLILADRPELVDRAAGEALADNPASLTEAFARGATTFAEAGGPEAYFGYPRRAGAAEGEASYAVMAEALADMIIECLGVRA